MTVKELIEILRGYPEDMKVITRLCSDYADIEPPSVITVITKTDMDYLSYHPHHHTEDPAGLIDVLYFRGN